MAPKVGDKLTYTTDESRLAIFQDASMSPGKLLGVVSRVDGNMCHYIRDGSGDFDVFIWKFREGPNWLIDWSGKDKEPMGKYWSCEACAEKKGGAIAEGSVFTGTDGICGWCLNEATLIPWNDFNWPADATKDKAAKMGGGISP